MQGVPQVLKGGGRHVGVADQVVSLADELFAGVSADFNKGRVGVGEPAFFIGFGDQVLVGADFGFDRSEEHTSELQSLMRISYAVFCLTKKNIQSAKSDNH